MRTCASLICALIAIIALALLAPLMVMVSVLIVADTRLWPIFSQQRIGRRDRQFTIYKFRTMTNRRDSNGRLLTDQERLTHLGSLLRRTSVDELPQLWNVARGDMAFVGPRPLLPAYLNRYTARQRRRHAVKPGITGWAQIKGRNSISWDEKLELDVWYVDHRCLLLDLRILLATAGTVVRVAGISHPGEATMGEFLGEHCDTSIGALNTRD
jgi:sugar transferase EpsL